MNKDKKNKKKRKLKISSRISKNEKVAPENIKEIPKALSTMKKLKTSPLKGPTSLTIIESSANNGKNNKRNKKKLGDGSFIAAEDH